MFHLLPGVMCPGVVFIIKLVQKSASSGTGQRKKHTRQVTVGGKWEGLIKTGFRPVFQGFRDRRYLHLIIIVVILLRDHVDHGMSK